MGGGISMNFLSAGIPVTIVEMAQDALDRGTGVMRKNYEATAAKGKMTPSRSARRWACSSRRWAGAARRLRPHHRGRVREYGREKGDLRQARQHRQAGRDPGLQHLLSRH
jgi:hypothetical protein